MLNVLRLLKQRGDVQPCELSDSSSVPLLPCFPEETLRHLNQELQALPYPRCIWTQPVSQRVPTVSLGHRVLLGPRTGAVRSRGFRDPANGIPPAQ